MTVMKWVRLDSAFPMNPKILALAAAGRHRAIAVYVCGLAYSGQQGTEGFIPKHALNLIHGRAWEARFLCEIGLWQEASSGWRIHDWLDYQPTIETVEARTERARMAALTRWHGNGSGE